MKQEELAALTIKEASNLIQARELSPVELVEGVLERIERLNPRLNAYITVMGEEALRSARRAEMELARGRFRGPLHGIPVSLKDIFATKGVRTTVGSKILADWVPDHDATVTARLRRAGAIIIGKTNLHEFAAGATNNIHYGPARNPWNPEHIPGGSSGGSGAAVAASMGLGSMGTDTGGSVRLPACLCGIVGLKPTYGRVSRFGIFPLSWSLDHAGPLTRTVEDCALMLQAIAGYDPKNPSSANRPVDDYTKGLERGIKGIRVGVPREFFFEEAEEEVASLARKALQVLEELGASLVEVSIPSVVHAPALGSVISWSESASIHEEWIRSRPQDYDPDVLRRFTTGSLFLATHYHKAQRIRTLLQREFQQALEQVDVIVTPTAPVTAPKVGERTVEIKGRRVAVLGLMARLTRPYNLAGLPAVTIPCGFSAGLPVGLQIGGRAFDEATVLRVAYAYQQAAGWHLKRPPL